MILKEIIIYNRQLIQSSKQQMIKSNVRILILHLIYFHIVQNLSNEPTIKKGNSDKNEITIE